MTSALAFTGQLGGVNYAASKGGIWSLTKTFAIELGPEQIRVNNIAPSATNTPMLRSAADQESFDKYIEGFIARAPLGRIGEPADIAAVATFCSLDASSWITGQTFHVNGGSIIP